MVEESLRYSEIARELGVSRQRVWAWFQEDRAVPAKWVLPLERITGRSRHDIRPDLYPRDSATEAA